MTKRVTDADFVESILEEMDGKSNRLKADAIVKKLGKRIRQRRRDTAPRIIREATEG